MEKQLRGSDALIEAYRAGGFKLQAEQVEGLAKRIGERDIHDILIKGQPVPDLMRATINGGDASSTGQVLTDVLEFVRDARLGTTIRVFPRGIPWPEEFLVDVTIAEHQQF